MTKTLLDPTLYLVQQVSELDLTLRPVDTTDNQGEPCQHCQTTGHQNMVTIYGFDTNGERTTGDCCVYCIAAVAAEYFSPLYGLVAEVAR
jgi:hypothetical protein